MKRKFQLWLWMGGVALLLGGGIAYGLRQFRPASKVIPTTHVQKGTLELDINTPGELHTTHSATLVAPSVNGTLQIVHLAKTGSQVKAGDVIVEFDPSEQEYNLEQSRSQLAEAEQQIIKARADAEVKAAEDKVGLLKAKFDVRRAELEVSRNELVSEIDAKKNLINLEEAKRRVAQLEQDINSRAASNTASVALLEEKKQTAVVAMKQAQRNIDSMRMRSPIDGLVSINDNSDTGVSFPGMTLPQYREGDLVNSGRFLAEVLDVNQMEVVAKVYESDRSNMNVGQTAEVRLDAKPEAAFSAKVQSIAGMASRNDFGPNAIGRFEVSFSFLNRASELRPGTSAQILVRGNQLKNQLYLPNQCLFEKDGKQIIFVKHGSGFDATPAKIKFRTENRIALENLPEGTEVALVNPEETLKKQDKGAGPSRAGVGP
jgi:multidrug resistance efflux pump